ncbi:MAG: peptide-methionine (R)-S-oxide reductase, partial [Candidatus Nanohaloarchaea archaeon]
MVLGTAGFIVPELSMAGYRFMAGNTPSELNVSEPGQVRNGSAHWVQDDYSDAIADLSRMERYVTQRNGTEPPFKNELYDNDRAGIYVDV